MEIEIRVQTERTESKVILLNCCCMSNYRLIYLLSIFSKIFEKVMHKRLCEFLEKNNVLYSLQFGFRSISKHSTSHTLISMTAKIRNTIDNGNYGGGIFIDLKKAFDTVNHSILLRKLDHYGIRGISPKWFESYLSNRNQYVSVNGHTSEQLSITHGDCHKGQCLDHFYVWFS